MVAILPRSLAWSSAPSAFCFKPAPPPSNGRHVLVCSTSSVKCGKFPMPVQRLDLALRIFLLCMPRICGQKRTALHLCAMKSQPNDSCPSLLETAVMLINNGADVNAPDAGVSCPHRSIVHICEPRNTVDYGLSVTLLSRLLLSLSHYVALLLTVSCIAA